MIKWNSVYSFIFFVLNNHFSSFCIYFSKGKMIISWILSVWLSIIINLSIPSPQPAQGGSPYYKASTKSVSFGVLANCRIIQFSITIHQLPTLNKHLKSGSEVRTIFQRFCKRGKYLRLVHQQKWSIEA